ncbi:hypothetical protein [Desulfuromonas sp.]|nr:hypothetical protein [Desulfuromonas sp.]
MLPVDAPFPEISATATDGRTWTLPAEIGAEWAVVLGYRAHW